MAAGQRRNGFSEGAALTLFIRAFEATHLYSQNQPLLEDWAFLEISDVAAMDSAAPAAADGAGRGSHRAADLYGDHADVLLNVQHALADTGKESLEPTEQLHGER